MSGWLQAEDTHSEAALETARKIVETIGKNFKPYAPVLLASIAKAPQQKPQEYEGDETSR